MILNSKSMKLYNNEAQTKFIAIFEDSKLDNSNLGLDSETLSKINFIIENEDINGKNGEPKNVNFFRNQYPKNIILVGLGKKKISL
ncbi:MAG: hypothetical protein MUO60_04585 [Clostridiaceae bacterium]|nr:hypothetical protein [Clostridiaceae bacterium]